MCWTQACAQASKTKALRLRQRPQPLPEGGAYKDGEILGLHADGCVIQRNRDDQCPYNSGETLGGFGARSLSEAEKERVALAGPGTRAFPSTSARPSMTSEPASQYQRPRGDGPWRDDRTGPRG